MIWFCDGTRAPRLPRVPNMLGHIFLKMVWEQGQQNICSFVSRRSELEILMFMLHNVM